MPERGKAVEFEVLVTGGTEEGVRVEGGGANVLLLVLQRAELRTHGKHSL